MVKVFESNEITEINGVMVENEFAIPPNAKIPHQAFMLYYNAEKEQWELSVWGGSIDGKGVVANGWECYHIDNSKNLLKKIIPNLMEYIETDEMEIRKMNWGE